MDTTLTGGEPELSGRVAGAVLKSIRAGANLTQAELAERLGVGLTTVQGWETGRRALINMRYSGLRELRRHLQLAGAEPVHLQVWDEALTADTIISAHGVCDPAAHPLALVVPNRMLTELLAWPIIGRTPRALHNAPARLPLQQGVRDRLAAKLRSVVDRGMLNGVAGAMLRRQVMYLLAEHPGSADWLREASAHDVRRQLRVREWSPAWPVARSQAVSAAIAGDPEPMRRFVSEGLEDDQNIAANLTYWAYWVGEINIEWTTDADMLDSGQVWAGDMLLASLLDGLSKAPYRELCAHTLWALLLRRRDLVAKAGVGPTVVATIDQVLGGRETLTPEARRRLEQVKYLLGRL